MIAAPERGTGRVLIVDDEPGNIRVLAEALGSDCEVRFATSGAQALEMAFEDAPDLVLLDVVMPGMGGFEVCRWLKSEARTRHVPVIFVTAMDELDDEERGFALGAVDYIVKPISPSIVRARARTHIELKRQRDLLEHLAWFDGLTGIANRRHFDEQLTLRWRAAQRSQTPLTLMLVDIDHFKQYNDNYGHTPGDDCLRLVGAALRAGFTRGDDLCARYGGEEFALILVDGDSQAQAARVLQVIAHLNIAHAYSSVGPRVSVSAGAIEIVPSPQCQLTDTIARVDGLLYEAKHQGRNRCVHLNAASGERTTILPEVAP
jgi:diguanylate cyclase (GGDEF)-like protein